MVIEMILPLTHPTEPAACALSTDTPCADKCQPHTSPKSPFQLPSVTEELQEPNQMNTTAGFNHHTYLELKAVVKNDKTPGFWV